MNDDSPQNFDAGSEPGEPKDGWYGSDGAADDTRQFDRPAPYGQGTGQQAQPGEPGQYYGRPDQPGQMNAQNQSGQSWDSPYGSNQQYGAAPQYGAVPQYGSAAQGAPKKEGSGSKGLLLGGVGLAAGLLLGGALGFAGGSATSTDAASATVTETTTVESTIEVPGAPADGPAEPGEGGEPAGAGATISGDGTFLVGADIEPGTYRTAGTDTCYWARLSGTLGSFDEIIANNFGAGQQVVTIDASDVAFETTRCGTWEKAS